MPFYNIMYVTRYRRGKDRLHGYKFEVSPWCEWEVSSWLRRLKSIFYKQRYSNFLIRVIWGVSKENGLTLSKNSNEYDHRIVK